MKKTRRSVPGFSFRRLCHRFRHALLAGWLLLGGVSGSVSAQPSLELFTEDYPPLTFERPDLEQFRCLKLALDAARYPGTRCAVLNGANEAAVGMFLRGEIGFNDISRRVERALERVPVQYQPSLADILEADRQARAAVLQTVGDMV